eukprot:m.9188 g.9188  ORF g.9188 m.9188 type:complete len:88 (+) comp3389_c0_seq2:38-301(+)
MDHRRKICVKQLKVAQKHMEKLTLLDNELFLLGRLIYKFSNQLSSDKSFQLTRTLSKGLKRFNVCCLFCMLLFCNRGGVSFLVAPNF